MPRLVFDPGKMSRAKRKAARVEHSAPPAESAAFDAMLLAELTSALVDAGAETWPADELEARIDSGLRDGVQHAHDRVLAEMDKQAERNRASRRRMRRGFERRLAQSWGNALNSLETLVTAFYEFGAEYYGSGLRDDEISKSAAFRALAPLHARACRITQEIIVLIESGFPDGALARWRTLHEVAITSLIISQEGDALAERYLAHEDVQRYKMMITWDRSSAALGIDAPTDAEKAQAKAANDARIAEYGSSFRTDFGWAAQCLGKERPIFADLEAHVSLDRFRPYYVWASDGVHAGVRGLIGTGSESYMRGALHAGSTNRGLADPGQNTAIALMQIATAQLGIRVTPFWILTTQILGTLAQRCQDEFIAANDEVERLTAINLERQKGEAV